MPVWNKRVFFEFWVHFGRRLELRDVINCVDIVLKSLTFAGWQWLVVQKYLDSVLLGCYLLSRAGLNNYFVVLTYWLRKTFPGPVLEVKVVKHWIIVETCFTVSDIYWSAKLGFLITYLFSQVLLVSPLFTWQGTLIVVCFMVAVATGKSDWLDVMFKCEGVSILNHLDLLKFNIFYRSATVLPFGNVGVLLAQHKVVLKLPKLEPLLLNPHKVGI